MESNNPALMPTLGGQIVRIFLENFMTYDAIEIRPGFHLNMIIGPNGTGKSTIVCAVLLGLGGKLKTLGRADQLSSYVKTGCDQSLIEIELYNPAKENIVIRRNFTKSNHSQFYINGKQVSASKVNDVRSMFNIQVDNLCTFLPQEKVQDFAIMNPQQLLEQTEKTIGNGELLEKHEKLKSLRCDLVSCAEAKAIQDGLLSSEVSKNERLLVKVKALKEKQALCERVTLLHQKKCWMLYHQALEEKKELEKDLKLAKKNLDLKKKDIEKTSYELKAIEDNSKIQQDACVASKREEAGKRAVVEDRLERLQHRLDRFADIDSILAAKIAEEERKKTELSRQEVAVDKLMNDLNALGDSSDVEARLKQEDQRINMELKQKHQEELQLSSEKLSNEEDLRGLQQELRNVAAECRLLESRRTLRLEYLKRQEPDVYESVLWVEKNQRLFHGKVYNPMLLELNVTDPKMARIVEAVIPYPDLLAFTVTHADDLNILVDNLRVKMKRRINIVTSEDSQSSQFQPNIPISRLKAFGLYAYVKDFIKGPVPIIRYLCCSHRIHNIPVGDCSVPSKCDQIPETIRKFFSDEHLFEVRVSVYSKAKSTTVKKLNDAKFFTESVDVSKITTLNQKNRELSSELETKRMAVEKVEEAQQRVREAMDELRRRRREIATRLQERERIMQQLERARASAERTKQTLLDPQDLSVEMRKEKEAVESALKRMLVDLHRAHEALEASYLKRIKTSVLLKASRIGIEEVQDRHDQAQEALRSALDSIRMVEDRHRAVETSCNRARNLASEQTGGVCPGDRGFRVFELKFRDLKDTVAEIEDELEETKARADFLDGGSAQVLTDYNNREEDIARLKAESLAMQTRHKAKLREIETHFNDWLEPVKSLVQTVDQSFSRHFAAMGCAGEVCLEIPDDQNDFNAYGIKIRVKFRDGVPLQDLSRNFQSGGERAVSTAIYMLSLQHITSVPFRFVDEINQGMDLPNERRITDLIVQVTSRKESSQYFFVTPKLMPELDCPDNVAVLCVHNGPAAVPASEWDVEKFIRRALGEEDEDDGSF